MEGRERGGGDALGLAFEAFGNQPLNTAGIEVKHARDQAKCKNVFALVLGRAADGFHSKLGNRTADVAKFFLQILTRLHMRGVVQDDAAFFDEINVVIVAVLVKGHNTSASSPDDNTSPELRRTWKMDGPPEMVEGWS